MCDSRSLQELVCPKMTCFSRLHQTREKVARLKDATGAGFMSLLREKLRDIPGHDCDHGEFSCWHEPKASPAGRRLSTLQSRIGRICAAAVEIEVKIERKGQDFISPVFQFIGPTALKSIPRTVAERSVCLAQEVTEARAEWNRLFKQWVAETSRYHKAISKGSSSERWSLGHWIIQQKRALFAFQDKLRAIRKANAS